MHSLRKIVSLTVAACAVVSVSGCAGDPQSRITTATGTAEAETPHVPHARVSGRYIPPKAGPGRDLIDLRAAVMGSASSIDFEYDLAEFLPRQLFSINDRPTAAASAGVLIGEITSVEPGRGYAVLDDDGQPARDADEGTAVAFDNPRSVWRVAVVTMKVDRSLSTRRIGGCSPGATTACTTRFGYAVYGDDPAAEMKGLLDLRDVVVVLDPLRTYPDIEPGLPAVARGGALLGDVDRHGYVGFPAMAEENKAFVGSLDTVAAIVKAAAAPAPPAIRVTVDSEGMVHRASPTR
jgi:hypothetical protein